MKTYRFILFFALFISTINYVWSQGNNFKIDGNNNLNDSSSFLGSINLKDFVIKTNSHERLRIDKYGKSVFSNYVVVQDSMRINGRLAIGSKSLYLDASSSLMGPLNSIYTTGGDLLIQSFGSNLNTVFSYDDAGLVLVGLDASGTSITDKLQVRGNISVMNETGLNSKTFSYCIDGNSILNYRGKPANTLPQISRSIIICSCS